MKRLRAWTMRLIGMFTQTRRARELADELDSHLQMHIDDNVRAGMTPEHARRHAMILLRESESAGSRRSAAFAA